MPIVHVAGTKGKGSTSAMIAAVLSAAGYRTGLFTSPHLMSLEERIAIDGRALLNRGTGDAGKSPAAGRGCRWMPRPPIGRKNMARPISS